MKKKKKKAAKKKYIYIVEVIYLMFPVGRTVPWRHSPVNFALRHTTDVETLRHLDCIYVYPGKWVQQVFAKMVIFIQTECKLKV